jgi:hypothetical protein
VSPADVRRLLSGVSGVAIVGDTVRAERALLEAVR